MADLPDHKLATVAQYLWRESVARAQGPRRRDGGLRSVWRQLRQHVESDGVDLAALFKSHSGKSGSRLDLAALGCRWRARRNEPAIRQGMRIYWRS